MQKNKKNGTANIGSPISYFLPLPSYIGIGPCPIQLVVVMAVRKAVRAATIIFTATSTIRFVFISYILLLTSYIFHRLVLPQVATTGVAVTTLVLGSAILRRSVVP